MSPRGGRRNLPALAALAVMVALVALACDDSEPGKTPGPHARPTAPDHLGSRCPPAKTPVPYPSDGVLPSGAVSVRLCNAPGDLSYTGGGRVESDFQPPRDALTTGVGPIVDLVNDLEPYGGEYCAGVGGSTHVYWFTYPDGTVQAVSWLLGACADVTVGPGQHKADGSSLHAAFAAALERQRAVQTPPHRVPRPHCGPLLAPTSDIVSPDSLDLSRVVACLQDPSRFRYWREAVLTPAKVNLFNHQPVREQRGYPRSRGCDSRQQPLRLRGYTVWGDLVDLNGRCGIFVLPRPAAYPEPDKNITSWRLTDKAQRVIGELEYGPFQRIRSYPREAFSDSTAPANG